MADHRITSSVSTFSGHGATFTAEPADQQTAISSSKPREVAGAKLKALKRLSGKLSRGVEQAAVSTTKGIKRAAKQATKGSLSIVAAPFVTINHAAPHAPTGLYKTDPDKVKLKTDHPSARIQRTIKQRAHKLAGKIGVKSLLVQEEVSHPAVATPTIAQSPANPLHDATAVSQAIHALFHDDSADGTRSLHMAVMALADTGRDVDPYALPMLATIALAYVCGGNPSMARAVLARLGQGVTSTDEAPGPGSVEAMAFAVAVNLAATPAGQDGLVRLIGASDAALQGPSPEAGMKREALFTFLQASSQLARMAEPGGEKLISPAALCRLASSQHMPRDKFVRGAYDLAGQALLCAAKVMNKPDITPAEINNKRQTSAYVAWRNDFHTAEPGSLLSRAKNRMHKFLTWMKRAGERKQNPLLAFHPARLLGRRKSPLSALRKHLNGAHLGYYETEAATMAGHLRSAMGRLDQHQQQVLSSTHTNVSVPAKARLLLHNVLVQWWQAKLTDPLRHNVLVLSAEDKQQIATLFTERAAQLDIPAGKVLGEKAFQRLQQLDSSALREWGQLAYAFAVPDSGYREFKDDLLQAVNVERGRPVELKKMGVADLGEVFRFVAENSPFACKLKLVDGSDLGINLGVTPTLAPLATQADGDVNPAIPYLSVGPALSATRGKYGVMEIGSSSHATEFFMGTETRVAASAGAYAGVSWLPTPTVGPGVTLSAGYNFGQNTQAGVSLSAFRTYNVGDDGKVAKNSKEAKGYSADIAQFMTEMAGQYQADKASVSADDMWDNFAEQFFQHQSVSVNWRDTSTTTHGVSVSLSAGVRGLVDQVDTYTKVRLGPSVTAGYSYTFNKHKEKKDATGTIQSLGFLQETNQRVNISATLLGLSSTPSLGNFDVGAGVPQTLSLPNVGSLSLNKVFSPRQVNIMLRAVYHRGRLQAPYTAIEAEFNGKQQFVQYCQELKPKLAKDDAAKARFDLYLQQIMASSSNNNQIFGETKLLDPKVAEHVNNTASLLMSLGNKNLLPDVRPDGVSEEVRQQHEARTSTFALGLAKDSAIECNSQVLDLDNWNCVGLYMCEDNVQGYSAGVNYLLTAAAGNQSSSVRTVSELTIPDLEKASQEAKEAADVAVLSSASSTGTENRRSLAALMQWNALHADSTEVATNSSVESLLASDDVPLDALLRAAAIEGRGTVPVANAASPVRAEKWKPSLDSIAETKRPSAKLAWLTGGKKTK